MAEISHRVSKSNPTKSQLPNALTDWSKSAKSQGRLCEHAQELCCGPVHSIEVDDGARIGNANFSTMATEGTKHSRNDDVLMRDYGVYWASCFFLKPVPQGSSRRANADTSVEVAHGHGS